MSHRRQIMQAVSRLLSYPTETYVEAAELLYVALAEELPEAAQCMVTFGKFVEPLKLHELEEAYTRTFDINPACALEVGWHLFGEEYARGLFLVRVRGEMSARGLEESAELPDHIAHVLPLIAAMSDEEARFFVRACVLPAVDKMQKALDKADSPYRHVIRCLAVILQHEFGRAASSSDDQAELAKAQGDLLRDFPMPCAASHPVELVPLRMDFNDNLQTWAPADGPQAVGIGGHDNAVPEMLRDKLRHGVSDG